MAWRVSVVVVGLWGFAPVSLAVPNTHPTVAVCGGAVNVHGWHGTEASHERRQAPHRHRANPRPLGAWWAQGKSQSRERETALIQARSCSVPPLAGGALLRCLDPTPSKCTVTPRCRSACVQTAGVRQPHCAHVANAKLSKFQQVCGCTAHSASRKSA